MRDGNKLLPEPEGEPCLVFKLPMRDGNMIILALTILGKLVFKLPMRDGNIDRQSACVHRHKGF